MTVLTFFIINGIRCSQSQLGGHVIKMNECPQHLETKTNKRTNAHMHSSKTLCDSMLNSKCFIIDIAWQFV